MDFSAFVQHLGLGSPFSVAMATQFLEKHGDETAMPHVLPWLKQLHASNGDDACAPSSPWQRGCPEILPGLTACPLWTGAGTDSGNSSSATSTTGDVGHALAGPRYEGLRSALAALESQAEAIRTELFSLRGQSLFQRYKAPSYRERDAGQAEQPTATGTTSGDWNVLYLDLHNVDCASARAACPITIAALSCLPRPYGHVLFSALAPHTHISTHTGPTNKKLRFQLPLIVPHGSTPGVAPCRLRVGPETSVLTAGKAILFDDSFQHEAWNESEEVRMVLIADVWHPDLTDTEVKFLDFVRKAHMRQAAALSASGTIPPGSDFYAIIQAQRDSRTADDVIFGNAHDAEHIDSTNAGAATPLTLNIPVRDD